MKAAVVSSFDSAPRYQDFGVPVPAGDDEVLADVLAAGLHPRVRSQADGSHYTSTDALPLVLPGRPGRPRPRGHRHRAARRHHWSRRGRRPPGENAADVDVVLDYLWGQPAADAMIAIITNRADRSKPLSWIEIGSVAGPTAPIPSAALRAARLQLVGSGQGSVSTREYLAELNVLAQEIAAGTIDVDARPVPLAHVEEAWAATDANHRIVFIPWP